MKGIILAGGSGTRLYPLTKALSKQILPVYDKPMIYYPLSLLMLAGIRDVLVITRPEDASMYRALLDDGRGLGIHIDYARQPRPDGLAQAFVIGRDFLGGSPACLVLGDNIMFGNELGHLLRRGASTTSGAQIFGFHVRDPERYGVVEFGPSGRAISLEEKPTRPRSSYAVPGVYFYGPDVVDIAASLRPSARGELEITDLNRRYLERGDLLVEKLGRGIAWFDAGTHRSLLDAASFIAAVEEQQGLQVACLEEIALANGWLVRELLEARVEAMGAGSYADYLREILREAPSR
jgi:glucose-1-phosphate thymidylyltransferase